MNDLTTYDLPNYVQPSSLERIKDKISNLNEQLSDSERGSGLIVSSPIKRRPTSIRLGSLKKQATANMTLEQATHRPRSPFSARHDFANDRPSSDKSTSAGEAEEDVVFRDSVLHCMFKALGLEEQPNRSKSGPSSLNVSPNLAPQDSFSQGRTSFGSTLGNLAMYGAPHAGSDVDSESAFTSNSLEGIESEIDNDLEIIHFPEGAVLVEAQERNPGLYYVIDGFLDVGLLAAPTETSQIGRPFKKNKDIFLDRVNPFDEEFEEADDGFKSLFLVKPGGIAGYQAGIGNYRSFVDVRAKTDVLVGFLPRASLERIMEKKPVVLLTMAKRLISLLSPLILHLDFALEWLQVNAGQRIYRTCQENASCCII